MQSLHCAFDDIGHFIGNFLRGGTRIRRHNHRLANHKLRVFKTTQFEVADVAANQG
ncbi:Uncharacterised protein [Vibrio cholerae]|nr:Uncharacterised protein [Vibrio cholerae]